MRTIYRYRFASAVPLGESATYDEIAAKTGLIKPQVFRIIRAAIGLNIFDEDHEGRVIHTAISRALATNEGFFAAVGLETDELGPASTKQIEAWEKFSQDAGEPNQSAFALYNENQPIFSVLQKYPERAKRFDSAMRFFTSDESWALSHMLHAFDWSSLDKPGARVVDLGGGFGQMSQYFARHTEHISFTVQDLPHVIQPAPKQLPEDLKDRVTFEVQDFMSPQKAANPPTAFLVSRCIHNWSDPYATQIIKNLVPALRPGSKVLIIEYVLDKKPVKKLTDRSGMQLDLTMATIFKSQERYAQDFERLLANADPRFLLKKFGKPKGSAMSLMEVEWR